MNPSPRQQDGTRRPPAYVPPRAGYDTKDRYQSGPRKPDCDPPDDTGYEDLPEPPEEPPILTKPPVATYPKKPAGKYPPEDAGYSEPCADEPRQDYDDKYAKKPKPSEPGGYAKGGGHPHPEEHEHEHPHGEEHPQGGEHPHPAPEGAAAGRSALPRQNQRNLTPEARRELHRRLRDYIDSAADPVGFHFQFGHVHNTPEFLPWHRQFLQGFEDWQRLRLADPGAFIPLAFWDPADPLPSEFEHPPSVWRSNQGRNANIGPMPLPLAIDELPALDFGAFSAAMESYHNGVHNQIGGDMRDLRTAPNDTCFWLFHAYVDHVFAQWEAMQTT